MTSDDFADLLSLLRKPAKPLQDPSPHIAHLAISGSHGYGTATATSDVDYRGVFAMTPTTRAGVSLGSAVLTSNNPGTGVDVVLYRIDEFWRLGLKGAINVAEMAWLDPIAGHASALLTKHRHLLLHDRLVSSALGMAKGAKDLKGKAHAVRCLRMVREAVDGRLRVWRDDADELLAIRNGLVPDVDALIDREREAVRAAERQLPPRDQAAINAACVEMTFAMDRAMGLA